MRSKTQIRAFTLVELLTVIAIVGVLVVILIPVIGSMMAKAHQSTCISNLRNLHQGVILYSQENNARIMPAQYTDNNDDVYLWPNLLLEYLDYPNQDKFKKKFSCPAYEGNQNGTFWMLGYAYNEIPAYLGDSAPVPNNQKNNRLNRTSQSGWQGYRMNEVTEETTRIMFTDGRNWHINAGGGLGFMEYDRHQDRRTNAVFFDGHVDSITQNKAEIAITDPKLYNQTPDYPDT